MQKILIGDPKKRQDAIVETERDMLSSENNSGFSNLYSIFGKNKQIINSENVMMHLDLS
jgi:hypothetical protein